MTLPSSSLLNPARGETLTARVRSSEHRRRLGLTANAAALSDLNLREDEQ